MNESSWWDKLLSDPVAIATIILALVTAILAVASFWTIWQNYKFREKDRKERLLNEIIEWAEEATFMIDEFKRGAIGTGPYHHRQLIIAKTANIIGVSAGFRSELGGKIEKALKDFDAFSNENNHTTQSFINTAESCTKSLLELIQSIGMIKGEL